MRSHIYSGFLYVIKGTAEVGDPHVDTADVAGISTDTSTLTQLSIRGGESGARIVLYTGAPQNERIIQKGPFVAGSDAELAAYYQAYRNGRFERISQLSLSPVPSFAKASVRLKTEDLSGRREAIRDWNQPIDARHRATAV